MAESTGMGAEDAGSGPLSDGMRERMEGARRGLLHLHKALLDSERGVYEGLYGPVTPGELLQLLIKDPWFAWLRPFSEMVVQIDEMQEAGRGVRALQTATPLPTEAEGAAVLRQVRELLTPTEDNVRCFEALQRDPLTVLAHAEVLRFLLPL